MSDKLVHYINQFGYLRNKDVAGLLYGDDVRKAQRATNAAVASGRLAERRIGNSSRFCLPTETSLLDNVTGHRDASNAVLIDGMVTGIATGVIPDRQIQINQSAYTLNNKIPDGLLLDEYECPEGNRVDYGWLEVENSERSGRDVQVLGDWLIKTFMSTRNWHVLPDYRNGFLAWVIVAVSASSAEKIEARLKSYIERAYSCDHSDFVAHVLSERVQFIRV